MPCKPLISVLREAGITSIDALKIDVEGAEDVVLVPFLRDAPRELFPELVLIEDTRGFWQTDVFALLEQHGYTVVARNRQNVALRRAPRSDDGGRREREFRSAAPSIARGSSASPTGSRSRSWSRCRGRPRRA